MSRTRSNEYLAAIDTTNLVFYQVLRAAGFSHEDATNFTIEAMVDNEGPDVKNEYSSWIADGRPGAALPHPYDKNPELAKADGFVDHGKDI